jgi:hypothetical protein
MEAAGLVIGVASVAVAIVALGGGSGSDSDGGARSNLAVVALNVRDVERGPNQPKAELEVILHNTGGRRVVIDRVALEVRNVYELRRCASQDDLPLSNTYGVVVPADAKTGEVLEAPLHQEVGADEADRFAIALSTRPVAGERGSLYLFELGVSLHSDGSHPSLPVGTALIALPQVPISGEYYWGKETAALIRGLAATSPGYVRELRSFSMPCWQGNTVAMRRAFRVSASRSALLDGVAEELVAPRPSVLE